MPEILTNEIFWFWLVTSALLLLITSYVASSLFNHLVAYHVFKHRISSDVIDVFVNQIKENPVFFLLNINLQSLSNARSRKQSPALDVILRAIFVVDALGLFSVLLIKEGIQSNDARYILAGISWFVIILVSYLFVIWYARKIVPMQEQARFELQDNRDEPIPPQAYLLPQVDPAPKNFLSRWLSQPFRIEVSLSREECVDVLQKMGLSFPARKKFAKYRLELDRMVYPQEFRLMKYGGGNYLLGKIYGDENLLHSTVAGRIYVEDISSSLNILFTGFVMGGIVIYSMALPLEGNLFCVGVLILGSVLFLLVMLMQGRDLVTALKEQLQSAERRHDQSKKNA
jgi:hypothetical protein